MSGHLFFIESLNGSFRQDFLHFYRELIFKLMCLPVFLKCWPFVFIKMYLQGLKVDVVEV